MKNIKIILKKYTFISNMQKWWKFLNQMKNELQKWFRCYGETELRTCQDFL